MTPFHPDQQPGSTPPAKSLRYLLLQVRNPEDPMRQQEVRAFSRTLQVDPTRITILDLLSQRVTPQHLKQVDVILLGGSGDYAAHSDEPWTKPALESLRLIHDVSKPTFASCWGFQAMARAMGGRVVHDLNHAEIGTHQVYLTEEGQKDPLFKELPNPFSAHMGHEDCVSELPPDAVLLAWSDVVPHQAYKFRGRPIYCTQFHPELNCQDMMERVATYPKYIEKIAGLPVDRFLELLHETRECNSLLQRFIELHF